MKLSDKKANVILAFIIVISLCVSTIFMLTKQGYHEDELLTYNLANSSKELNTDGWNSPEDFNEYLAVSDAHRFDYAQVYKNQIIDASHPPFYYALVHTVCSFFPNVFNKWLAYSVNIIMMTIALILLFKIGKRVTDNNLYALIATGGYAFSVACITTTVYLRMYATLTMFVLAFLYLTLKIFDRGRDVKFYEVLPVLPVVILGVLTQYYFIMFAGLIGLVFLVLQLKRKAFKSLVLYIVFALAGAVIALIIYPYIIENVLGGNRGLGSLDLSDLAAWSLHIGGDRLRRLLPFCKEEKASAQIALCGDPRACLFHRYLNALSVQQRPLRYGFASAYLDDVHLCVHQDIQPV